MSTTSTTRHVLSRRLLQQHRPPPTPYLRPKPPDVAWPTWVVRGTYAVGCLSVPCAALWCVTAQPAWREKLLTPAQLEWLRPYFGDSETGSYPGEWSLECRQEQARIEEQMQQEVAIEWARIDSMEEGWQESKLSASMPLHQVRAQLAGDQTAVVALQFPNETSVHEDRSWNTTDTEETDTVAATKDTPRTPSVTIYSPWHYHTPPPATHEAAAVSDKDTERARLQAALDRLQEEQVEGRRDMDDVADEIRRTKAALRKLRWGF